MQVVDKWQLYVVGQWQWQGRRPLLKQSTEEERWFQMVVDWQWYIQVRSASFIHGRQSDVMLSYIDLGESEASTPEERIHVHQYSVNNPKKSSFR